MVTRKLFVKKKETKRATVDKAPKNKNSRKKKRRRYPQGCMKNKSPNIEEDDGAKTPIAATGEMEGSVAIVSSKLKTRGKIPQNPPERNTAIYFERRNFILLEESKRVCIYPLCRSERKESPYGNAARIRATVI